MRIGDEVINPTDDDLYEILGFDHETVPDKKAIHKAYKRLALEHHPDRPGGDENKFKALVRAYKILSDPGLRQQYDALYNEDDATGAAEQLHKWMQEYIQRVETDGEEPLNFLATMADTLLDDWLAGQSPGVVKDVRNIQRIAAQSFQLYNVWTAITATTATATDTNTMRVAPSQSVGAHPFSPIIPPDAQGSDPFAMAACATSSPYYLNLNASLHQWFGHRKRRIRLTLPKSGRKVSISVPLYKSLYEWRDDSEEHVVVRITLQNDPVDQLPRWSAPDRGQEQMPSFLIYTTDTLDNPIHHPSGTNYCPIVKERSPLNMYWMHLDDQLPILLVLISPAVPPTCTSDEVGPTDIVTLRPIMTVEELRPNGPELSAH